MFIKSYNKVDCLRPLFFRKIIMTKLVLVQAVLSSSGFICTEGASIRFLLASQVDLTLIPMLDLEHFRPRWPPVTQSAWSGRSGGKVGDCEQSNNSPFVETIVYKMMFFRSVHLEILKLHWYSFHITVKLKQHTLVLMLSLVTGLYEFSGTILTDNRTVRWVSVNLSQLVIWIPKNLLCVLF